MNKTIEFAVVITVLGWTSVAIAAPPTATPNPGYDSALAESPKPVTPPVVVAPGIIKPKALKKRAWHH